MEERMLTFFAGGCHQFWIVYPETCSVTVAFQDGRRHTYVQQESIPLEPYGPGTLSLTEIFDSV
jgi:hypothetical protein